VHGIAVQRETQQTCDVTGMHDGSMAHDLAPDEPAVYEAALRNKEQLFGPDHPEVCYNFNESILLTVVGMDS
jgi:hypothetical protein